MNSGELFLIVIAVIMVCGALIATAVYLAQRPAGPSKRERELERLVDELLELAYEYKETDAALSYKITDTIKSQRHKELN